MLAAENLTIARSADAVLHNVSARFEAGQITAIVGPNGAGKSTLLMALAGLLEAQDGKVTLGGEDIAAMNVSARGRALGYLPQSGDIAWDVALEVLVALGRMPHGDTRAEPVDAAIAALELDELRRRPVSTLSGGERARALLARVLAGAPRFVLADEPLAALDLAHQLRLARHLRQCAEGGQGVVIVLHDLALAMNHADQVVMLSRGEIAYQGRADEALAAPHIADVWGVSGEWIGEAGQRAWITHGL